MGGALKNQKSMFNFLNLKPEAFGIDVSDLSLKIVKLKKNGEKFALASFGEASIKPGIIEDGEIKKEKALANVIKTALTKVKGEKLKTKYIVASLPEEKAFLQVIQLPKMKKEEFKKAVYFEAENYIPLPIDQVYIDAQIISPICDHLDHLDILIAALPKKTVDPYLTCFKEAGLKPKALEIESQAISRALVKDETSVSPLLLIDLGAVRTSFIIFAGHSLRFTFSIPVSSQGFTQAIAKTLKIDFLKAEKLKLKYGLKTYAKEEGGDVFEAMIPALTDLIEQIKKHFTYYQSHASHEHLPPDGKGLKKIFLCGGGANLKGLTDFLGRELKTSVEIGNPWMNILAEDQKEPPQLSLEKSLSYTTAFGLALRGILKND